MSRRPARAAHRAARRAVVTASSACAFALLAAGPALAESRNDQLGPSEGADLGSGITGGETLLLFVLAPLGIMLVVAFIFGVRSLARSERYRPGKGWGAAPVWFAGPHEPVAAVEAVTQAGTPALARGGASGDW